MFLWQPPQNFEQASSEIWTEFHSNVYTRLGCTDDRKTKINFEIKI